MRKLQVTECMQRLKWSSNQVANRATHIVCIFLASVLHKPILLMHICYAILGQVDIDCRGIHSMKVHAQTKLDSQ